MRSGLFSTVKWVWSYSGSSWILAATALILAVWVVPFQLAGQPQATIDEIAWNWWPVRILYGLLALSTAVCSWQRLRRDLRRARRPLNRPAVPPQNALRKAAPQGQGLRRTLEAKGYAVTQREGGFDAVLHRWSPLGGSLFHIALIVFVLAIVVQHFSGQSAEIRVTEGQSFSEAAVAEPEWARSAVAGLTLAAVKPSYYKDVLLFTGLDATIEAADGGKSAMSLSHPRWLDPFTHVSIQDYGLAPHLLSVDSTGTVLDEAIVAMNIFPPGAEDSVELVSSGINLAIVAYPDYGVVDGEDVSLSYNIRKPAFRLAATSSRDGALLGRGIVALGQPLPCGASTVTVTGLSRYGTFKVFRSYSLPLALLGGVLALVGLLMRFGWPRHDVVVWEEGDTFAVDSWLDGFGRQEGRRRAARLMEDAA